MTDELVDRLRAYNDESFVETLCGEAADRIEALIAERDRLSVSNMQMLGDIAVAMGRIEALNADKSFILEERDRTFALMLARAEKAETERDRLQSALRHIVTYLAEPTVASEDTLNSLRGDLRFVGRVASAALKGEGHE